MIHLEIIIGPDIVLSLAEGVICTVTQSRTGENVGYRRLPYPDGRARSTTEILGNTPSRDRDRFLFWRNRAAEHHDRTLGIDLSDHSRTSDGIGVICCSDNPFLNKTPIRFQKIGQVSKFFD